MKKIGLTIVGVLFASTIWAQKNAFLERDFWNTNPNVQEIESKIKDGNDPAELSNRGFDATATAILADVSLENIEYLISLPQISVDTRTHDGRTYLIWAAMKANLPVIKALVKKGADVNIKGAHGYNAINFAANGGVQDKELYDFLIESGADIKQTNDNGATAILLIMPKLKDAGMITYFESKGLDVHSKDSEGNSAFNYAAKGGNVEMMNTLIKRGVDYKGLNNNGENAILYASHGTRGSSPSLATFRYLSVKGFEINTVNKEHETPLLLLSGKTKDIEVLKFFLAAGVDANRTDAKGNNALMNAAGGGSLEIIKLLASKTKNINQANEKGETALTNAVQRNSTEVISYLIAEGAQVNVADKDGNNLLYYWANSGAGRRGAPAKLDEAKLNVLIKNGLDVKKPQPNGNTLLHIAVQNNNPDLVEKATALGVDINAKNKEGNTALLLAALNAKDDQLLKLLISKGAKKSIKTSFGESAYDLANENEVLSKKAIDLNFLK